MAKKKTVKKSAKVKRSKKAAAAKSARKAAKKPAAKTKKLPGRTKKKPALPRPTITGEEKLFLLFREDYHARQIFDFLRVETVHELEQFTPDEIFERLTRPMAESVERIRSRLAEKKRYLSGDVAYMLDALQQTSS